MLSLAGRVALVTGARSGIGAAAAQLLAGQGAITYGADFWPSVDGAERADSPAESSPKQLRLDVREEAEWQSVLERLLSAHERLDILVHAAGISAASPLLDTTLAEWRRVMSTNLDGSFLAIRCGIQAMRADGGAIVLVGSASGIRPSPGAAAYSTSKAAVGMLVRAAAKECREGALGIRINAVSPAGVKTPMWLDMPFFQDLVRQHGSEDAAFAILEADAGGPFADPHEIARTILFLVSDSAAHVTGVELPVDGGYIL